MVELKSGIAYGGLKGYRRQIESGHTPETGAVPSSPNCHQAARTHVFASAVAPFILNPGICQSGKSNASPKTSVPRLLGQALVE